MSRVLVVEDSHVTQLMTASFLTDAGHEVLLAGSGQQAIDIMRLEKPDVVLLDIVLPTMSGIEVLQSAKADPDISWIPVIAVSGVDRDKLVLPAGTAMGVLFKPYEPVELLRLVKQAVADRGSA